MGDSLHRFGLTEFLATVCPGAFLLALSVFVWVPPDQFAGLFSTTIPEPFLWTIAVVLLLIAYAVGLILSAWASAGAVAFSYYSDVNLNFAGWLKFVYLWLFHWCYNPFAASTSFPEALYAMYQRTLGGTRIEELVQPGIPQETAALFRLTEAGSPGAAVAPLINEADTAGSKRSFSLGVAHAFLISGIEALLALPVHQWKAHLIVTAVLGILLSFMLRYVAGVLWEQEFRLTCLVLSRRVAGVSV